MFTTYRSRAALLAALVVAACTEQPTEVPDLAVAVVEVTPQNQTLTVGDTMVLIAHPRTADGDILGGREIAWSSGDTAVASVTTRGEVGVARALTPGTTEIRALVEGKIGTVTLNVVAAPLVVASVTVTPSIAALEVGKQFTLFAMPRTADGTVVGGRAAHWQSSDSTIMTIVGSVNGSAVITAHRTGDVVISAKVDGVQGQRTIRVKPAPSVAYAAIAPDSIVMEPGKDFEVMVWLWGPDGRSVEWSAVQWTSLDNSVASVKSVNGQRAVFTTHKVGTVQIRAEVGNVSDLAKVIVKAPEDVYDVSIVGGTFAGHTLWTGQEYRFHAVVRSGTGEIPNHPVAWRVEDPTILDLRADGVAIGLRPGTTRVSAEAGGKTVHAYVTVYPLGGNGLLLKLRPSEDAYGFPRAAAEVGHTTWTDANGTVHPAIKLLVGGTLNIGRNITGYEQTLEIETVVVTNANRLVVGRETIVERGTVMYDVIHPLERMWLHPNAAPNTPIATHFLQPGRLVVPQKVGSAPLIDFLWVVQ